MDFSQLTVGTLVRWNGLLLAETRRFNNAMWHDEPLGCLLHVVSRGSDVDFDSNQDWVGFECAEDCGCHAITTLTRAEEEAYTELVGRELFVECSMTEAMALIAPADKLAGAQATRQPTIDDLAHVFDVDQQTKHIEALLSANGVWED